jgi:cytochrome c oxidase cbb3-type subunit 3
MSSRCRNFCWLILFFITSVVLSGCNREQREFASASEGTVPDSERLSSLQPTQARSNTEKLDNKLPADYYKKYEGNAYKVAQGKRLFRWYNCNGCHGAGGGHIGPALMDEQWLYGSSPHEIFATIRQGRPNGMPSFAGHIPDDQLWQIVAYVRSMSGQLSADVAPSRADSLSPYKPESRREKEPIAPSPAKNPSP